MLSNIMTRCVRAAATALVLLSVADMPRAQGGKGIFFDVSATGAISWFSL